VPARVARASTALCRAHALLGRARAGPRPRSRPLLGLLLRWACAASVPVELGRARLLGCVGPCGPRVRFRFVISSEFVTAYSI